MALVTSMQTTSGWLLNWKTTLQIQPRQQLKMHNIKEIPTLKGLEHFT